MKTNTKKILISTIAGFAALNMLATNSHAQGFSFYGQNARGFAETTTVSIKTSEDLDKNVYAIDNLADQMAFRLGWELKFSSDSKATLELHKQMKAHAELTNNLINAYRGKGGSFQSAAQAVSRSVDTLVKLKKGAKISEAVSDMIDQSVPLISFVINNSANFTPVSS